MSESLVFGRYVLHEEIGRGGAGVVWRATDTTLGQIVALKRVSLAGLPGRAADERRERTLREARLAATLRGHHHVVSVYDVCADQQDVWLILEYLPSQSLARLLAAHGTLPPAEAARVGAAVADALAAAHAAGIVHRDVSPGNVLIGTDGRVKLTDFGISRAHDDPHVTQTGTVHGTVAYLAPEVANTGESSPESDVYSLGSTVYSAVEGMAPFGNSDNALKLLNVVRTGLIRPPEQAGPLGDLLMRLLQLDPVSRPDAGTAAEAFRALAAEHPAPSPAATASPVRPAPGTPDYLVSFPPDRPVSFPPGAGTVGAASTVPPGLSLPAPGRDAGRPRRPALLVGGLAALLVVMLAVVLATTLPHTETGAARAAVQAAGLPRTAPPLTVGEDTQTIDLCALVDPRPLSRFGAATVQRGLKLADCRISIAPPDGSALHSVDLGLKGLVRSWAEVGGRRSDVGGLMLFRRAFVKSDDCRDSIGFADLNVLDIEAYQPKGRTLDLCDVVRVVTDGVLRNLTQHGLPRDRSVLGYTLAHRRACELLDHANLRAVPRLNEAQEDERSDHWYCSKGTQQRGQAFLRAEFDLATTAAERAAGYPNTTIAGRPAHLEAKPGEVNDRACQADVLHARHPGGRTEILRVWLDSPGEDGALCATVRSLAGAAERHAR